jgi:adenosylcobinamide-GDP ribazoletransferase
MTGIVTLVVAFLLERCRSGVARTRLLSVQVATAALGAIGFLTRLPVGVTDRHWDAFRRRPAVICPIAVPLGAVLAVPLLVPLPRVTAALCVPVLLLLITGITHLDGLADLGDAAVVHGDAERRRSVMRDTTVGVGALAITILALVGLVLAADALSNAPAQIALAIVVTAEVGAKLGMVAIAAFGRATHEGLGSALTDGSGPTTFAVGLGCALPITLLSWPGTEAIAALGGALASTAMVLLWTRRTLGGVSGDVFGATNELARLAALHTGVIAWTL